MRAQAIEALDSRRRSSTVRRAGPPARADVGRERDRTLRRFARLADDEDPWIAPPGAAGHRQEGAEMPATIGRIGDLDTMLLLRRVPLFEGLEPEDLQRIAMTAVEHLYPADEAIVREGDLGRQRWSSSSRVGPRGPRRRGRQRAADPALRTPATTSASWRCCARRPAPRRSSPRATASAAWSSAARALQGDPARTAGCRDGDAGDAGQADQRAVTVGADDRRDAPTPTCRPAPSPSCAPTSKDRCGWPARSGRTGTTVNATHLALLRDAVERHGGVVRPDRGRRAVRVVPGGRRRGRSPRSTRNGRSAAA